MACREKYFLPCMTTQKKLQEPVLHKLEAEKKSLHSFSRMRNLRNPVGAEETHHDGFGLSVGEQA